MADTATTRLIGVFDDYDAANRAAQQLANEGFSRERISLVSNQKKGAAGSTMVEWDRPEAHHEGGISGFFHRFFGHEVPEDEQGYFAEAVRRGNAVVAVNAAPAEVERAVRIMNENGAVDVDRRVAFYREKGYRGYDPSAPSYTAEEAAREREEFRRAEARRTAGEATRQREEREESRQPEGRIPVIEEELHVGKRVVQRGGVRVYTHVTERPVEEQVRLREEHVNVERRPADRPVSGAEASAMHEQTIEIPETVEEPVVQKRARVKEEIVIGKETSERTETIRDTVRHTEVEVEQMGRGAHAPEYKYGRRMAGDPRYRGRSWEEVEPDLRRDYERAHPDSAWDKVRSAIRSAWESITGRR